MKKLKVLTRIIILITFLISCSLHGFSQYQWINPLPQGNSLKKVIFPSENVGYAFGYHGTALKTLDKGIHWSILNTGTTKSLNDAYFIDENFGFVVGDSGTIIFTEDQGVNWTVSHSGISEELYAVYFTDNLHGYSCGQNGMIIRTMDGGQEWDTCYSPVTTKLYSIDFPDEMTGYIAGGEGSGGGMGYVLKTNDGGMNWNLLSSELNESFYSIEFTDPLTGYAAGNFSYISKTIDGGDTWTTLDNPNNHLSAHIRAITFVNPQVGYTCDVQGHVMKTEDAGLSWENLNTNTSSILFSIGDIINNSVCTVGSGGLTMVSSEDGLSFILTSTGTRNGLYTINETDADHLFILGHETLIKSTDGGANWETQIIPELQGCMSAHFIDTETGYALISWGKIYKTTDAGLTWAQVYKSGKASFYSDIHMVNKTLGFAVGGGQSPGGITWGTLLKTNDGNNWINQDCPANNMLFKVYFLNLSQGFLLGVDGQLFITNDAGASWSINPLSTSYHLIDMVFVDEYIGYMIANYYWANNQIFKTLDGGLNWKLIYEDSSTIYSNALKSIHFYNEQAGYGVGINGRIIKTMDGGSSWLVLDGGTNNWLNEVLMTDDSSGYIIGEYGTILSFGNNNMGIPNVITHGNIGVLCYPNPFIDIIHFELYSNSREEIIIEIYDITGRLVFKDQMIIGKGQQTIEVSPGHHLNTGTYFYKINGENIFNAGKIIKPK